ncbi:MAG: hypothetical protein ABIZ80_12370 [Bryobacteraceae bacterium]
MLAFIAAEAREFAGLLPFCREIRGGKLPLSWSRRGELNGREVLLAANGAGRLRAGEALLSLRSAGAMDGVVNVGFCGALETGLRVADVFVASGLQVDGKELPVNMPQSDRPFRSGLLVSVDRVAQSVGDKRELRESGAAAVEMEAAGLASRVREWGIPFFCVRSVTDLANEGFVLDFNAVRLADGRFSMPLILAAAMRRPFTVLPELLRLRSRSVAAAASLGEFIANCRF